MSSGLLGFISDLNSPTLTTVYTVPSNFGGITVSNISLFNKGTVDDYVSVAVNGIYIEYLTHLGPNEGLNRSCGVLSPGDVLAVSNSSGSTISVFMNGLEIIGYKGGTLATLDGMSTTKSLTYTISNTDNSLYTILDFNVVNKSSTQGNFTVDVNGVILETTALDSNTGVFRPLGPLSAGNVLTITTDNDLDVRVSGKIY